MFHGEEAFETKPQPVLTIPRFLTPCPTQPQGVTDEACSYPPPSGNPRCYRMHDQCGRDDLDGKTRQPDVARLDIA